MGLIDVEKLRKQAKEYDYDGKKSGVLDDWSGLEAEKSGSSRPQVGRMSGGGRPAINGTVG
jgi:hypothetical protein